MDFSFFSVANILLLFGLIILSSRFFWLTVINNLKRPMTWRVAVGEGRISPRLSRLAWYYPDKVRLYSWWLYVDRLQRMKVPGDFAEVGVYRGESAAILHLMAPERRFHLFDTFTGFPEMDLQAESGKPASYTHRHFSNTSVERVLHKMGSKEGIVVHVGRFPDSASDLCGSVGFALVNIDVDLYLPTLAALSFFYPRLSPGGVLFVHDYHPDWPGVIRAVDEFSGMIPESVCLLPDRDGTVVILKNRS